MLFWLNAMTMPTYERKDLTGLSISEGWESVVVRKQGIRSRNGVNSRKQRGHTFPTNKKEEEQTESKVGL